MKDVWNFMLWFHAMFPYDGAASILSSARFLEIQRSEAEYARMKKAGFWWEEQIKAVTSCSTHKIDQQETDV